MVSPRQTWPAAVSVRSAAALAAPVREATVLGAFPHGLYLHPPEGGVLPVVASGGLRLPTALWLPHRAPRTWGVQAGARVLVGGGEVLLPGVTLRAVRTWTPEVVPVAESGTGLALPAAASRLRQVARDLCRAAVARRDVGPVVRALVGAGSGLTPSGDDVLCGVLLGLRLSGCPDAVSRVWSEVTGRLGATTHLSASLLREAAAGYAVPAVVRLTTALAAGRRLEVDRRLAEVLAVGHTSGSDLVAGLAGALDAVGAAARGQARGCADPLALIRPVDQCQSISAPLSSVGAVR